MIRISMLLLILLTACNFSGSATKNDENIPITVCINSLNFTRSPIEYALEYGIFEKHGLEVETFGLSGGTEAATVLTAGQADICQISGPAVVNSALAGSDLKIIGGLVNQQIYSLVAAKDIASGNDLRGKVVGVSEPGTASDAIMHTGLELLGLDPTKDVTILSVGSQSQRVAALETGTVAATVVTVPESGRAKSLGFRVLLSPEDMKVPHQHTAYVTTKQMLEENPEVIRRYLMAIGESIHRIRSDRDGVLNLMAGILLLDLEEDAPFLEEAYNEMALKIMDQSLYPSREGIERLIAVGKEENTAALDLGPEDIIDTRILDELHESGYFQDFEE